jgi:hypothetical protein
MHRVQHLTAPTSIKWPGAEPTQQRGITQVAPWFHFDIIEWIALRPVRGHQKMRRHCLPNGRETPGGVLRRRWIKNKIGVGRLESADSMRTERISVPAP